MILMNVYHSVTELIGKTPLLALENYGKQHSLSASLFAKLESFNPAGSAKDRVALEMILDAEKSGKLTKDSTMIVMPETMSVERQMLMRAYGAELILTDGKKGMSGAIEKAEELTRTIPNSFIVGQFTNPANPEAHRKTTGPEIWDDTDGKVDIFVAGVGTGGTITGVGEYLKAKNPDIKIIAVEPSDSPLLSGGKAGAHPLQGIGANFIPTILNTEIYDEVFPVSGEEAYKAGRDFSRSEGILVGISAGAALHAATEIAKRPENKGKNIVVLLPDTGDRYLSTPMFAD